MVIISIFTGHVTSEVKISKCLYSEKNVKKIKSKTRDSQQSDCKLGLPSNYPPAETLI